MLRLHRHTGTWRLRKYKVYMKDKQKYFVEMHCTLYIKCLGLNIIDNKLTVTYFSHNMWFGVLCTKYIIVRNTDKQQKSNALVVHKIFHMVRLCTS